MEETGTVAQHQHRQKGQRQGGTPPLKFSYSFLYNKYNLYLVCLPLVIYSMARIKASILTSDTLMLNVDEAKNVLQMNALRSVHKKV